MLHSKHLDGLDDGSNDISTIHTSKQCMIIYFLLPILPKEDTCEFEMIYKDLKLYVQGGNRTGPSECVVGSGV